MLVRTLGVVVAGRDNRGLPDDLQNVERPLTDEEIREIRAIIEADKRAKWLWANIRTVAIWIAAVLGALMLAWDSLVRIVKSIVAS